MNMTPEMMEMMHAKMSHYLTNYWSEHATPEMKEKAKAEGKTIKGAMGWIKSIAQRIDEENGMRVMPDAMAYWCFMEYMEHEKEGAVYRSPDEIEKERVRAEENAKRAEKELERVKSKQAEMQRTSLWDVSLDEAREALRKANAEAKKAKAKVKEVKKELKQAEKVEEKIVEASLDLFAEL